MPRRQHLRAISFTLLDTKTQGVISHQKTSKDMLFPSPQSSDRTHEEIKSIFVHFSLEKLYQI